MRLLALVLLLAAFTGCAAGRSAMIDPAEGIRDEIAAYNEAELFACGTTSYQAEDYLRAALCFSRLADEYPRSKHWYDAQYNAGVAWEAMQRWSEALVRYQALLPVTKGDLDPLWRAATCLYELDRYDEAIALVEPLVAREDLSVVERIRARTYMGVCKVEKGELSKAELDFRKALDFYKAHEDEERVEKYFPSQAQFFLGEVYRLHFEKVKLEAVDDLEKLKNDLEYKAQLLLSAQGHYLRAIRMGHPHWATAAGQRVGGLYEQLYDEMTEAPVPATLDADQAEMYRAELRKKVRVLVQKAIAVYERTLSAAERVGVASAFVEATRESLDRMKQILLADAAREESAAGGS